jgi:guanosine-diphosphatase
MDPFEKAARSRPGSLGSLGYDDNKAAWETQRDSKSRYIKIGGAIAVVLLLAFVLLPGGKTTKYIPHLGGQEASETAAETSKCTKSYSADKPLIQYALMVDAGSTGSRIHVYKFNNCGPTPELENEVFKMTEKREKGSGLSSVFLESDAEGAAKSLDTLMDTAIVNVPESYRSCTPVAVKATAGLRKLGEAKSLEILAAVRHRLETAYPFPVLAESVGGVEVMDGKDEGVYAWITTNYLLGKIGTADKTPTAAVFDLGGGSTQIVFQPTFAEAANGGMPEKLQEGDHKYALKFGGREFELYQHSYLGYGLMAAREALHQAVVLAAYNDDPKSVTSGASLLNPCIAPGMSRLIEKIPLPAGHALGSSININMTGPSTSGSSQCRSISESILHKDAECTLTPCAFNGVHQPSLSKTFAREEIFLFSYFYDRLAPLGMPESFTLEEMKEMTGDVCAGEEAWGVFKGVEGAMDELRERPEHCLDLNFMLALLHTGYEMPMEREVRIAKKIGGNELGWCLGARYVSCVVRVLRLLC